eukprot:677556-Prorocentrum_minimum.AAC.1
MSLPSRLSTSRVLFVASASASARAPSSCAHAAPGYRQPSRLPSTFEHISSSVDGSIPLLPLLSTNSTGTFVHLSSSVDGSIPLPPLLFGGHSPPLPTGSGNRAGGTLGASEGTHLDAALDEAQLPQLSVAPQPGR